MEEALNLEPGNKRKAIVYFVRHGESVGNKSLKFLPSDTDVLNENGKQQAKLLGQYFNSQNERFSAAFSSTFPRARETAQIVLHWSNGQESERSERSDGSSSKQGQQLASELNHLVSLVQDPRLIERDMGIVGEEEIAGVLKEFKEAKLPFVEWDRDREGAESCDVVKSRISGFLDDLLELIDREHGVQHKIVVVSHGSYYIHMAQFFLTNPQKFRLEGERPDCIRSMENSAFFKVVIEAQDKIRNSNSNSFSAENLTTATECTAGVRRLKILSWNNQKHLKGTARHLNSDLNQLQNPTKDDAMTTSSAFNLVSAATEKK